MRLAVLMFGLALVACGEGDGAGGFGAGAELAPLPEVTATSPSTTTVPATTAPPKAPIVLGFAGDVSFTHGLDERAPLSDVAELLAAPDLTVVNLETTIGESDVGEGLDKTYVFKSPPRSVDLLADAGVDAVSLANNHTLDYRREGLLRTMELLDAGGIDRFGSGADSDEAYAAAVLPVGDWTVALVGFTHIECGWVVDDPDRWPEAAWACPGFEDRTVSAVEAAAADADLVVVMAHWGIELDHCPQGYQRDLAATWVAAGADLVVGSHPHVLQGVERIDGAWVLHSTGNFAFPSARQASARSAYFTFEVTEGEITPAAHPVAIVDGRPAPLSGESGASILEELATRSLGWSFDADGRVLPRRDAGECG